MCPYSVTAASRGFGNKGVIEEGSRAIHGNRENDNHAMLLSQQRAF